MTRSTRRRRSKSSSGNLTIQAKFKYIYGFASVVWLCALLAYGFGYWQYIHSMGGRVSGGQMLVFAFLLLAPLGFIWGQYQLLKILLDQKDLDRSMNTDLVGSVVRLEEDIEGTNALITEMRMSQNQLATDLLPHFGARVTTQLRNKHNREKTKTSEPTLPFGPNEQSDLDITLNDIAHVLNFSDQKEKGDWANAFAQLSQDGRYLDFIRMAEDVIEVLESEGIYVEDLNLRTAQSDIWLEFASGERGEAVQDLAGIRDPSVLALTRGRLRNDPKFHDVALRFQKQFIHMLDELSEGAADEDFLLLNQSRGGRVFIILAEISGLFR